MPIGGRRQTLFGDIGRLVATVLRHWWRSIRRMACSDIPLRPSFGGERALRNSISGRADRRGFVVSAGIASTSICARTMARHVLGKIMRRRRRPNAVSPLPLSALGAMRPSPAACAAPG